MKGKRTPKKKAKKPASKIVRMKVTPSTPGEKVNILFHSPILFIRRNGELLPREITMLAAE